MTAFYTSQEERWLSGKLQPEPGALGGIELFKCSDGNYRDAEAKARYDEIQRKIRYDYGA